MTRYVLILPFSSKPSALYESCAHFARTNGFKKRAVQTAIKKYGYYESELGFLWPVEMVEEKCSK